MQGGAQSSSDEDKEEDTGDTAIHNGRQARPEDHQPPGHIQEGVHQPRGTVPALPLYVCICVSIYVCPYRLVMPT